MELRAIYDSRKEFYGKAVVEVQKTDFEQTSDLYSYGTLVASINYNFESGKKTYYCYGKYSQTTTRHQKEFFKQNGLNDRQIKEIFTTEKLEFERV